MPPKGDLIRFVAFFVVFGVGSILFLRTPWPWYVLYPIHLACLLTVGVWYRRRWGDRWPIEGRGWLEGLTDWRSQRARKEMLWGAVFGILAAILILTVELIAGPSWD